MDIGWSIWRKSERRYRIRKGIKKFINSLFLIDSITSLLAGEGNDTQEEYIEAIAMTQPIGNKEAISDTGLSQKKFRNKRSR